MARTIQTIYNEIVAAKEANADLETLDSTSATAIWRLWAWITATILFTVETMHDLFRAEIDGMIATKIPGTLPWYQSICFSFQYGDGLVFSGGVYGYAILNEEARIIDQCSVREAADGLVIKVAKDVNGELEPLTTEEENSFQAFIQAVKFAGTHTRVINIEGNKLQLSGIIYYDPLLINADGTSKADGSRPVDTAIENYLRALPFDGRLKRTALNDAILAVSGVFDLKLTILKHKYAEYEYQDIDVSHVPESGYFRIDALFPLNGSFTYTPHV
jgi:hypothetical protein